MTPLTQPLSRACTFPHPAPVDIVLNPGPRTIGFCRSIGPFELTFSKIRVRSSGKQGLLSQMIGAEAPPKFTVGEAPPAKPPDPEN